MPTTPSPSRHKGTKPTGAKAAVGREQAPASGDKATDSRFERLVHELRVHQVELELQNEELRDSRERAEAASSRYRDLYDHAPVAYLSVDRNGTIRGANVAAVAQFRVPQEALVGRTLAGFVRPEARRQLSDCLATVFAGRPAAPRELEIIRPAYPDMAVQMTATLVPDGALARVVMADLSDRKIAAAALAEREATFRAIVEGSPLPQMVVDAINAISFVNAAFERTFGYSVHDVPTLGAWWRLFCPDQDYRRKAQKGWARAASAASADGGIPSGAFELRVTCRDGTERVVIGERTVLIGSLQGGRLVSLLDFTERRRLEQAVLEAASHEREHLAMDLHDGLGQELTGLALMLAALAGRFALSGDRQSVNELKRLSAIASHCIDTARTIAHGMAPIALQAGSLASALRALAESSAALFEVKFSLDLTNVTEQNVAAGVADPAYRIAQEAITNAVKHGKATRITIGAAVLEGELTLTILDDGAGFHPGTTPSGMGIEMMRYRARALGGQLQITNGVNGGTEVRLECPSLPMR